MTDAIDTQALLSRLQGMAREAGLSAPPADAVSPTAMPGELSGVRGADPSGADFGALVGDAMRAVDARADAARELTVGYERGRPDVDLADVMIAAQKARISFEALVQVRNKMVSAYRDIMNMPI